MYSRDDLIEVFYVEDTVTVTISDSIFPRRLGCLLCFYLLPNSN